MRLFAVAVRQTHAGPRESARAKSADQTPHSPNSNYRNTGKPRIAHATPRRQLHAGKAPNGVRLEKPVPRLTEPAACRKNSTLVLWSWRRDSNPRPSDYKSDALPTELRQHVWGKMRHRANLSLGSLPDVRDN